MSGRKTITYINFLQGIPAPIVALGGMIKVFLFYPFNQTRRTKNSTGYITNYPTIDAKKLTRSKHHATTHNRQTINFFSKKEGLLFFADQPSGSSYVHEDQASFPWRLPVHTSEYQSSRFDKLDCIPSSGWKNWFYWSSCDHFLLFDLMGKNSEDGKKYSTKASFEDDTELD